MNNTLTMNSYTQDNNQGQKVAPKVDWKEIATIAVMFTIAAGIIALRVWNWAL